MTTYKRIVIKYGGSLLYNQDGTVHIDRIGRLANVLRDMVSEGHKIVVVVGGGLPARTAIHVAKKLGASQTICDYLGIRASQQNAAILLAALNESAYPLVPSSIIEALKVFSVSRHQILVMGGVTPGQSTDAVSALMAELLNAPLLIRATDVDGVYDKDPQQFSDAKKYDKMTYQDIIRHAQSSAYVAGSYALFDIVAAQVIHRSKIPTWFIDGRDPVNIKRILAKEKIGTLVTNDK
ncbi:MAG: UMP kinase [Candidatus Ranarchaeia archaeon]